METVEIKISLVEVSSKFKAMQSKALSYYKPLCFSHLDEVPDGVNYKRKIKDRKTGSMS